MTRVRVKGFKIFNDRHGRPRCYHRATGTAVDLVKAPLGSAEFFAECSRIVELARVAAPKPGTLGLLINEYRASATFQDLAPATRSDYQKIFDYLQPIKDTPLVKFDRPLIVRIRDKAAEKRGRRFGNYVKAVFSLLFGWGAERGFLPVNTATGIKNIRRPRGAPRANRPWSDEERFAVLDAAPWHLKVPIALGMFVGLREADALRLTWAAYDGTMLQTRTRKTGQLVAWPAPAALRRILDQVRTHQPAGDRAAVTIAVTTRGTPWTESGFRASWRKFRLALEEVGRIAPGLTFHGLRHTVGTILAEEGFDARTIATALGQATEAMANFYSRDADRSRVMTGVVRRMDVSENKRRAKVVKPFAAGVKPKGSA